MGVCHVQQSLLMQVVLLLLILRPPLQFTYEKVMFTPFNIMVSPLSVTREALPVISSASRPPLPHAVRSTMTINPCYHMLNSRELHCLPDAHWGKAGLSKVTVREMTEYREMGGLVSLESLFFLIYFLYCLITSCDNMAAVVFTECSCMCYRGNVVPVAPSVAGTY